MNLTNRVGMTSVKVYFCILVIGFLHLFSVPNALSQTYDFDEGIEVLTRGLISGNKDALKDKKIAVFGIIESKSRKRWEISSHIEDGVVDVLVNKGYEVIERRRIDDVVKKEIKKGADWWYDEAKAAQFGKLVGADVVVTGRYVKWGGTVIRVSIRAINVSQGKVLAANKVKILTDRIADLLRPEEKGGSSEPLHKKPLEKPKPAAKSEPPAGYPQQAPPGPSGPTAPQMAYYCCDQFGNRRCALVQPVPMGSPCFCMGQGWGFACK